MAKCAGCSGGGAVNHVDTECVQMNGDGSLLDPLSAILEFHPASKICLDCFSDGLGLRFSGTGGLECGVGGLEIKLDPNVSNSLSLSASGLMGTGGGGGGGGNVIYFTVGTPGPNGFGGVGATPPTLFAAADYQGDGVNDSVAIQAALDASAALAATTSVNAVVLILPGIYVVNTSLQPKGVPLIGAGPVESTIFYCASFLGAPANTRTIDSTISGSQFTHVENLQLLSQNGGAAVIKSEFLQMINCSVLGDSAGADAGLIDVGYISNPLSAAFGRFEGNTVSGTSSPFPDPGLILRDPIASNYVIRNNSFSTDVVITGSNHSNAYIDDNLFQSANLNLNATSLTYFKIRGNRFSNGSILATLAGGSSFFWQILNNTIENGQINLDSLIVSVINGNIVQSTLFGDAYVITNGGEHRIENNTVDFAKNNGMVLISAHSCVVIGNRIRFFGAGTVNVDDGLRITTSDECLVQGNSISSSQGRYGINVVSGTNNMVTNNKLNSSGLTASFVDTASGTITAAGNML